MLEDWREVLKFGLLVYPKPNGLKKKKYIFPLKDRSNICTNFHFILRGGVYEWSDWNGMKTPKLWIVLVICPQYKNFVKHYKPPKFYIDFRLSEYAEYEDVQNLYNSFQLSIRKNPIAISPQSVYSQKSTFFDTDMAF